MNALAVALSTFLLLWVTLLIAGSVVIGTGGRVRPVAKLPVDPSTLHPYELAYLAGGPMRTAQTVLVALRTRGVLEPTGEARVLATGALDEDAGPLEAAAVRLADHPDASAALGVLARRLAASDAMADLRRRLRSKRLLMGPFAHTVARVRLHGTLVLSLACLVVPPLLSVVSWRQYDPGFASEDPPPGLGMLFIPFAVLVGIGGLQAFGRCGHVLRAGLGRRARNTVATARAARTAESVGVGGDRDGGDGDGIAGPAEPLIEVALNGSKAAVPGSTVPVVDRRSRPNSDDEYNGGVLRFVGRGGSGRHGSSSSSSSNGAGP